MEILDIMEPEAAQQVQEIPQEQGQKTQEVQGIPPRFKTYRNGILDLETGEFLEFGTLLVR